MNASTINLYKILRQIGILTLVLCTFAVANEIRAQTNNPTNNAINSNVDASTVADFEQARKTFKDFRVESIDEFIKIKTYHEQLLTEGVVTHTFTLANGNFCKCITIASQPSVKSAGVDPKSIKPETEILPGHSLEESRAIRKKLAASFGMDGTPDMLGHIRTCPIGSIPVLVPSLEDLCRFKRLEDRLRKYPSSRNSRTPSSKANSVSEKPLSPIPPANDMPIHEYGHAYRYVPNLGSQATFNIWIPSVAVSTEFSLSQLWVSGGQGNNLQTVEAGWQVFSNLYGDILPHLFIYFTTNNYANDLPNGAFGGAYNLSGNYFQQINSSVVIGGPLYNYSFFGTTPNDLQIGFNMDPSGSHNWLLTIGGIEIGYYPNALFSQTGIALQAQEIDYGGEIVNNNTGGIHTTTEMGSGQYPSEGYEYSAYVRQIKYFDVNENLQDALNLTPEATSPAYYDAVVNYSNNPSWGEYLYFGGGPYYSMTALYGFGVGAVSAYAINNSNLIVGEATITNESRSDAFAYSNGVVIDVCSLGNDAGATALNDIGQIVGNTIGQPGQGQAFLYSSGRATLLGTLHGGYCQASAINNHGQIVGTSDGSAFIYSNNSISSISSAQVQMISAAGINDAGSVVGVASKMATLNSYTNYSVLLNGGVLSQINCPPYPSSINNKGQITGSGLQGAWLYSNGAVTFLGSLDGSTDSSGSCINNNGVVVGTSSVAAGGTHGFLYNSGGMQDLNNLISPISSLIYGPIRSAWGINDKGWIVGNGYYGFLMRKAYAAVTILNASISSGNTITLQWNSIPGQSWQVQTKSLLTQPTWQNQGNPIESSSISTSITIPIGTNMHEFLRVSLLPSS